MEARFEHIEIHTSRYSAVWPRIVSATKESTAICFGATVLKGHGVSHAKFTKTSEFHAFVVQLQKVIFKRNLLLKRILTLYIQHFHLCIEQATHCGHWRATRLAYHLSNGTYWRRSIEKLWQWRQFHDNSLALGPYLFTIDLFCFIAVRKLSKHCEHVARKGKSSIVFLANQLLIQFAIFNPIQKSWRWKIYEEVETTWCGHCYSSFRAVFNATQCRISCRFWAFLICYIQKKNHYPYRTAQKHTQHDRLANWFMNIIKTTSNWFYFCKFIDVTDFHLDSFGEKSQIRSNQFASWCAEFLEETSWVWQFNILTSQINCNSTTSLSLFRFLKHLMMTNNTLTMGTDFTIVLLCNAYSTNPDYFTKPMAALFETINKTPVGATQPTVPLSMVTLDSLTVHAKMSLIHRYMSWILAKTDFSSSNFVFLLLVLYLI